MLVKPEPALRMGRTSFSAATLSRNNLTAILGSGLIPTVGGVSV